MHSAILTFQTYCIRVLYVHLMIFLMTSLMTSQTCCMHVQMLSKEHGYSFMHQLGWQPATILDAGANAGFATVVLAHLFPAAKIIALEPDPANFALPKIFQWWSCSPQQPQL